MAVLGLQLLHETVKIQSGLYFKLSSALDALIKGETSYSARVVEQYRAAGISTKGLDISEEFEADIVGNNIMDRARAGFAIVKT